jgi:hypothetical protein
MPGDHLSTIRQFLRQHVESHEHLETLLLLCRGNRSWTAEAVASELKIPPESAQEALRHLVERGLAVSPSGADPGYLYAPKTGEVGECVKLLTTACREQRLAIMEMMSAHAIERMRAAALRRFADAFRLRGPDHG